MHARTKLALLASVAVSAAFVSFNAESAADNGTTPLQAFDQVFAENYQNTASGFEVYSGRKAGEQYPQTVYIVGAPDANGYYGLCTGAVIGKRLVITARHCVNDAVGIPGDSVFFGPSGDATPARSTVVAKSEYCDTKDCLPAGQVAAQGAEVLDIALIQLRDPAPVKPVKLATANDLKANRFLRVVGYGEDEQGNVGERLWTDVPLASAQCLKQLKLPKSGQTMSDSEIYGCISGRETVAGYFARDLRDGASAPQKVKPSRFADTCSGDSGGPAYVVAPADAASVGAARRAFTEKRYLLAAATSRGFHLPTGPDFPNEKAPKCGWGGIYSLMSGPGLDWIKRTAKQWNEEIGSD